MVDSFDDSIILSTNLSFWQGLTHRDDKIVYDPDPLDLYTAASLGEADIVRSVLEMQELKSDDVNSSGWSALMYAAYMGHDQTVQVLICHHADLNIKNSHGFTPLILASMCGNDSIIKLLIKNGAEIDAVDKQGWSALFHTASAGHQQSTDLLLQSGANCEITEPSQCLTPLMEAAASGHEVVVQLLLKKGANIYPKDSNGDDAWSLATAYGHTKIANLIERHKSKNKGSDKHLDTVQAMKKKSTTTVNKCNLSGPSIHAGPKAFAQMTGLGSDGKPHPHNAVPVFLQDHEHQADESQAPESTWNGPKNLESFLSKIGCQKYLKVFEDHGVDLHIFLTLTDADLKDIGITLFGPRRKMVSAIARSIGEIQSLVVADNRAESSFADALSAKNARLHERLKELEQEKVELSGMCAKERELRKVTESVLMEHQQVLSAFRLIADRMEATHIHLCRALDDTRSQAFSNHFESLQMSTHQTYATPLQKERGVNFAPASLRDLDLVSKSTGEIVREMRSLVGAAASSSPIKKPEQSPAPNFKRRESPT